MSRGPIRVLLTKLGLDWHNWGVRVIARKLAEAGMEVIYEEDLTPEEIVQIAIQEDVDVIGLSSLTGAYRVLTPKVMRLLKEKRAEDVLTILGGIIQKEDIPAMKEAGIAEVFGARTSPKAVIDFIRSHVPARGN